MSKEQKKKQIRNALIIIGALALIAASSVFLLPEEKPLSIPRKKASKDFMPTEDPDFSSDKVRLSHIEIQADGIKDSLKELKQELLNLQEDKILLESQNKKLEETTKSLSQKISELKAQELQKLEEKKESQTLSPPSNQIHIWGRSTSLNLNNVSTVIPAGTVVKCLLASTAFCGVGVNSASNPRVVLLQPVDNGQLPWKIRVALKGSRIICDATGDLPSERVYMRATRLTKMVGKGGDFIGTSIAGCVIGDDGAEGVRGVVVDRSGKIIMMAGFASFLQGVGQGIQASLNNQTLAKLGKVGDTQSILNVDTLRNAGIQGGNTSINKLAEYYIKRAEQLQPVIQITRRPARYVDVLFLKDVKIGETNIKGKIDQERKQRDKAQW